MDSKIIKYLLVSIFIFSNSLAVEFNGKFMQGHFIVGQTETNSKIYIDRKEVKVSKDGFFVFGIDRDRKFDLVVTKILNGKTEKITKKIYKRKYQIQRIDGLDEKKVTPPEEVYNRLKEENNRIGKARAIDTDLIYFKDKFITPVDNAIITGVYGSQRILNGKPRWPHYGLDYAQKTGTPIKAMLSGVVTLAEKDLYYTGATLVFDHGHGISTLYMHMNEIFVEMGQEVKKGDIIGTVGKSGRATGPHLDVRLNWFDVKLDPGSVLN